MRHYFGYDIDGKLRSVETYGPTGWPTDKCMADPTCNAKAVASLRERRGKGDPEIINWALFDCPCDPAKGLILRDCSCLNTKFATSYVDVQTKTLHTKPQRTVYVDGEVVTHNQLVTRAPGNPVEVQIASAGMPDGYVIQCFQKGTVDLHLEDEWGLEVTNGVSETTVLIAPAQGTRGVFSINGKMVRPMSFVLRGFATS